MTIETIIICIAAVIAMAAVYSSGKDEGYKKGYSDAMNGTDKMKLVEFDDGTRDWYLTKHLKHIDHHKVIK
jgi:hypothetical protein